MKTKPHLKNIVLIIFCVIEIVSYAQTNVLIDTLILHARTNEKTIILQNKIGERREYLFNDDNKLTSVNHTYISNSYEPDENHGLRYYVDSFIYVNDTIYFKSYTYILTKSNGEYIRILENKDSSTLSNIDYQLKDYGDSVVWYSKRNENMDKHILAKIGGQFTKYSYRFNARGRELANNWIVKHENQKTFLIDTTHSKICIDYDIIILNYSKLGTPKSLYIYDWLLASYNEPDIMKYIMSKRQIKKPLQIFEITYCPSNNCLFNNALELKTIKAYLKYSEKHDGYF